MRRSTTTSGGAQFSLVFLFFLLTACAIVCAILRVVTGLDTVFGMRAVMTIYVLGLSMYFIIRVPIIVRRLLRRRREVRLRREELVALVDESKRKSD